MHASAIAQRSNFEHRLFVATSLAVLLLVFVGFAHTYFLKIFFADAPVLTPLVHLHGALMSAWFALFVVQTYLVAKHRVDWHRRLGVVGVAIAIGIVAIAPIVLVGATARELRAPDGDRFFYVIFAVDAVVIADFAIFVAAAIAMRRRTDVHKRLMLLATASIVLPALGRLPLGLFAIWTLFYACVLVPVAIDTWRHQRLHAAFGWGAPALLASQHLAFLGAQTAPWKTFMDRMFT